MFNESVIGGVGPDSIEIGGMFTAVVAMPNADGSILVMVEPMKTPEPTYPVEADECFRISTTLVVTD